jgi:hypothetical protein
MRRRSPRCQAPSAIDGGQVRPDPRNPRHARDHPLSSENRLVADGKPPTSASTSGRTASTRWAARSTIRRPPQLGQNPRPLHENATSRSAPQPTHRNRAKPPASQPQRRKFRNSRLRQGYGGPPKRFARRWRPRRTPVGPRRPEACRRPHGRSPSVSERSGTGDSRLDDAVRRTPIGRPPRATGRGACLIPGASIRPELWVRRRHLSDFATIAPGPDCGNLRFPAIVRIASCRCSAVMGSAIQISGTVLAGPAAAAATRPRARSSTRCRP